ncbi:hypothetical protein SSS_07337 [Sarcoptes scabiei]|nr:hypothetical protein SSS_07337 [Sarcoptes scabiei]
MDSGSDRSVEKQSTVSKFNEFREMEILKSTNNLTNDSTEDESIVIDATSPSLLINSKVPTYSYRLVNINGKNSILSSTSSKSDNQYLLMIANDKISDNSISDDDRI